MFDQRIGCFSDPPPPLTQEFIINLKERGEYLQKLVFGPHLYKIYPTKTWRKYESLSNNDMHLGHAIVKKVCARIIL